MNKRIEPGGSRDGPRRMSVVRGPGLVRRGRVEAASGAVDCADCGVRVDLAPDPVVTELALAA